MKHKANKLSQLLQTIQDEADHCLNTDGSDDRLEVFIADVQVIHEKAHKARKIVDTLKEEHQQLRDALAQLLDRLNTHGSIDHIREEGPIQDAQNALARTL